MTPLEVMENYCKRMDQFSYMLNRTTLYDKSELVTQWLERIEWLDAQMKDYLYDELTSELARYNEDFGVEVYDVLPPTMRLVMNNDGFLIENVPKWMLGHGAKSKHSPLFRNALPSIRKRQVWIQVMQKLVLDYRKSGQLLNRFPPEFSRLVVVFRSKRVSDVRDLDHYLPKLEPLVNAMKYNNLIRTDFPVYFMYAFEWQLDETLKGNEVLFDLHVYTSDLPYGSWRRIGIEQQHRIELQELKRQLDEIKNINQKLKSELQEAKDTNEKLKMMLQQSELERVKVLSSVNPKTYQTSVSSEDETVKITNFRKQSRVYIDK